MLFYSWCDFCFLRSASPPTTVLELSTDSGSPFVICVLCLPSILLGRILEPRTLSTHKVERHTIYSIPYILPP